MTQASSGPVVLLSCVKLKRAEPSRAMDLYISPLFQKMATYARSLQPRAIFILSARHGLLHPDDVIAPYEQSLGTMSQVQRREWAAHVRASLQKICDLQSDHFTFLAGRLYRDELTPYLGHYDIPLQGLGLGQQLQWLTAHRT